MNGAAGVVALAFGLYAANAVFGASVRTGLINSQGFHWIHHALYVATLSLGLVALSSLWWSSSTAGWFLIPALVALVALPYAGSARRHPYRHIWAALVPLPFYILSLIVALRT